MPKTNESKKNQHIAKVVHNILKQEEETKQYVLSAAPAAVFSGAGGILVPLSSAMAQGVGSNQRVGDKVQVRGLDIRMSFYNGLGATSNVQTTFRAMVFQFFQDSVIALPVPATYMLLGSAVHAGGVAGAFSSFNVDYMKQYKLLWDSQLVNTTGSAGLAVLGSATGDGIFRTISVQIPLKKSQRRLQYTGGGGSNMLYLFVTTNQPTIATNPTFAYDAALWYADD